MMNQPVNFAEPEDKKVMHMTPITDYNEFYQFYLGEHQNIACRRLHVLGSSAGLFGIYKTIRTGKKRYLAGGILAGYACAWVGHFFFEKNKPASFKQPVYSFISDWYMLLDVIKGDISLIDTQLDKKIIRLR